MTPLNKALLRLTRRAEKLTTKEVASSFVDVGSVFYSLDTRDSQVVYGRRGTGKTHILYYLIDQKVKSGEVGVALDMRTIGSSGGLYADSSISLSERATRLLCDTLLALHAGLLDLSEYEELLDVSKCIAEMDAFIEASGEIKVEEVIEVEEEAGASEEGEGALGAALGGSGFKVEAKLGCSTRSQEVVRVKRKGYPRLHINFGSAQRELTKLVKKLPNKRLWVVLDEWSEVPLELQPYLADMLARVMFPIAGVVVKVAAIKQRTNFRILKEEGGHIGFEVGADISAGVDLDESLVFENDSSVASEFFANMLWKHILSIEEHEGAELTGLTSSEEFVSQTFTQIAVLEELVRAAEGIPRDAINIVANAASKAGNKKISIKNVRSAALYWYQTNKHSSIAARPEAALLLAWIVDKVIQGKKARAFLVNVDQNDELINFLYDARGIHLIKQNVSGKDTPGARFNVYSLDYGLYVDLINTSNQPVSLFPIDESNEGEDIDIPMTDYRSVRRAILDLDEYYKNSAQISG